MTPRALSAGAMLSIEGAPVDRVWYVVDGVVALVREAGERRGVGVPWTTRRPGSLVGEEALVQGEYADSAIALTHVTACSAEAEVFRRWAADGGARASHAVMEAVIRTRCADGPRASSAEGTASRRVARWLAEECRGSVAPGIPRSVIAGLLGMLPETFSRALARLVTRGAITVSRKQISVVDAAKLLAEADD
jgi:CRP-like cAMP-binding protein